MKEIINRFKSPAVIAGIISIVGIILTTAGISPSEITSWEILLNTIIDILSNPFTLGSIAVAIFAFLNNPTNKKGF